MARAIFASPEWQEFDAGRAAGEATCSLIHAQLSAVPWPHPTPSLAELKDMILTQIPARLQTIPASVAVLQQLKVTQANSGLKLHYLSNMPAPYADALDAQYEFIRWFDSGIFSGRERIAKPEAAVYELAEQRFGISNPATTLFIDDHPSNIAAAHAAGWQTIHLTQPGDLQKQVRLFLGLA
jgi:putative hydrolase of the HAD superfamily